MCCVGDGEINPALALVVGLQGRLVEPREPSGRAGACVQCLRAGLELMPAHTTQGIFVSLLGRYLNSLGSLSTQFLSEKGLVLKVMLCFSLSHRVLSVRVLDSKTTSHFY